jgi:hypothetical protein
VNVQTRIIAGDDDPRHGTQNGYSNLGCRCEACRVASNAYQKAHKAVPCPGCCGGVAAGGRYRPGSMCRSCRAKALMSAEHGTESRYKRCKCGACTLAATEARRRRRNASAKTSLYKRGMASLTAEIERLERRTAVLREALGKIETTS